ncbi:CDP-alcohol phosphatidyltransferase family protein [Paracoccus suum]|uniref:CDP-alcohol phosphatidyltransferase family protein n=1 Tax=Paracoccus suum TaxID=2259340 RepID=A0A344PGB3_9RHOB|nr:CDP-alcohol phosphatidyltransferase family protein [Paracoccus suum]AXC48418.1 CDP-alcohol phosphatidyltransferase family protein [Paracoccus suum]
MEGGRRPLKSRATGWAAALTRALARTSLTPNQISAAGVVAAALSGAAFMGHASTVGAARVALLILAAGFVQLRLLCNLLDGMVAVEAGRGSADGRFWNEFTDRLGDLLILGGVGFGIGQPALGFACVAAAFLTAYIRELGVTCGAPADFRGPMAKPHRMALITVAAIVAAFEPVWSGKGGLLQAALWLLLVGTVLTAVRRVVFIIGTLRRGAGGSDLY